MKRERCFVKRMLVLAVGFALMLPVGTLAGSLEPSASPAPTMRTLEEQKPAWNKIIPTAQRFVDALDGTAVLDKETGLVWAKSPGSTFRDWADNMDYCTKLTLGGRKGWRPPTIEELTSLLDSTQLEPSLPNGHPFLNVQLGLYWSSSNDFINTDVAWGINMSDGYVGGASKGNYGYVWPVRSGH